ncbi:MAG: hypothetical protein J7501_14665, partial [Bdellovibrio sp.]|nr:hypothetical protein [Bdellovibrio sp.]
MKFLITLIFTLLTGVICQAQSLGYLRVKVVEVNPLHHGQAVLKAVNTEVMSFSHSTNEKVVTLNSSQLSTGKSTNISVDYAFGETECKFEYQISYSMNQNGPWINIPKVFHAPNKDSWAVLPLGICGSSVCSSNESVQR